MERAPDPDSAVPVAVAEVEARAAPVARAFGAVAQVLARARDQAPVQVSVRVDHFPWEFRGAVAEVRARAQEAAVMALPVVDLQAAVGDREAVAAPAAEQEPAAAAEGAVSAADQAAGLARAQEVARAREARAQA